MLPNLACPIILISSDSRFPRRSVNKSGRKEGLLLNAHLEAIVTTVGALRDLFLKHFQEVAQRLVSPVVFWC